MTARDKIAHQLGLFFINGVEQEDRIAALENQIAELGRRLHESKADERGPSGAVTPPDTLGGS